MNKNPEESSAKPPGPALAPGKLDGKVKWFSIEKGYGFVVGDDNLDRYFHVSNVIGADLPARGDVVSFQPAESIKGPRATQITIKSRARTSGTDRSRPDDRVDCRYCKKKMVPRIITGPPVWAHFSNARWQAVPKKSICPYCAATHKTFDASTGEVSGAIAAIVLFVIVIVVIIFMLAFFQGNRQKFRNSESPGMNLAVTRHEIATSIPRGNSS